MPLLNNRRIPLTAPPPYDPRRKRKEVWYLRFTNEIFTTYEEYINRLMLYHQPIWTCEATGRGNLTYEQALESEGRDERNRAEFRFCETLRRRILHRILFQTVRLEPLVEDIYGYFKFNYAPGEVVHCTLGDATYLAKILEIIPGHDNGMYRHANGNSRINRLVDFKPSDMSTTSEDGETESETEDVPRQPNGRLRFPDAFLHPAPATFGSQPNQQDSNVPKMENSAAISNDVTADSLAYQGFRYKVQLINEYEMPIEHCVRIVEFSEIRRDKRTFCRHTIQRLIRECAYRDSYVAAPWIIKPNVARQYGIDTTLPAHLQEAQDLAYAKLVRKRKAPGRFADDKDAEKRARREETLINRAKLKEEKERQREERRRQAAVKYPMEDLDLPIYRKDPNMNWALIDMSPDIYTGPYAIPYPSGGRTPRPVPQKNENIPSELFEDFISVWSFLSVFSEPLGLLAFSIDEFERALCQIPQQGKSTILVESNACLLNVIIRERKDDTVSEIASGSAMEEYVDALEEEEEEEETDEEKEQERPKLEKKHERGWRSPEQLRLTKGWDNKEIRSSDRKGWETVLIGCLNDIATPELVPEIDDILSHLVPRDGSTVAERERRYPTLSMKQKLDILNFLVQAVNESMLIKDYMEECQEQLTEFRRQRVDLNKEGKSLAARRAELERKDREEKEEKEGSEDEEDGSGSGDEDNSEESEVEEASSNSEDSDSSVRGLKAHDRRHRSRQEKLRLKQQKRKEAEALQRKLYQKQREAAKARNQELRQKAEERRKLEEEEKALRKKEEQLERDMKKYMTLRVKPLGRDRFYNRYIYLDNIGTADTYGTGRLYIQSPSEIDIQILRERDRAPDLPEQAWGRGGGRWFILDLMKHHGFDEEQIRWLDERLQRPADDRGNKNDRSWWRAYSDPEDIHALLSWLNPKGVRENKLKNEITKRLNHIFESMRKREQASSKPEPTPKRGTRSRSSLST